MKIVQKHVIRGGVHKYGDNIDTDVIAPGVWYRMKFDVRRSGGPVT